MENKIFEPTICPICGEYEFVDDTELEKADPSYDGYQGDQCSHCGWVYDIEQLHNPELTNGNNELSIIEYRKWFNQKLKENPNYDYSESKYEATPHMCPVCGKNEFSDTFSYEICPFCGWEDDGVMEEEPEGWGGNANDLCLKDFKARYTEIIKKNPFYKYSKDGIPAK